MNEREKRIYDIVSTVKIVSLLLTSIIFFQYTFYEDKINEVNILIKTVSVFIAGLIFLLVYFLWTFSIDKRLVMRNRKYGNWIEYFVFIAIFFIALLASEGYESPYKILFLFIICTATIESGLKAGLTTAGISSALIIFLDLISLANERVNMYFQNDLILVGIFMLTAWILGFYVKIEGEHIKQLEKLVNFDALTGLYNHKSFQERLKEEVFLSEKVQKPVSMIFFDIDYFKHYNDLNGHQKGDEVLKTIGEIVKRNVRKEDFAARYGGEEFAIILPETNEEEALRIADKIREAVEKESFYGEENQPNKVLTISAGVSVFPDNAKDEVQLLKSADDALYRAKFFNKNRVERYKSILEELEKDIEDKDVELVSSVKTLISVINAKDRYTYGHSERVVLYSRLMADKLNLSKEDKENLIYGAYMHDIGKINIPKEVLMKKMPLTNEEWEMLKQHPENGVEIIKNIDSLSGAIPIILHHHERYNGKGYPYGLKAEEIPYLARILSVVDSFDAMTSNRPYNKRKTYEEAIEELKKCSGTQFDPEISQAFIEVIKENSNKFDNLM
ncbi:bifunctional diguanylate cyclase/phosphohydrolase [Caproiciproducens sp. MSJ-32]|uniref:bifunctional diguanylate cyclase/phosphohydrolase n=1 Tax=Caproiciproducens sp. MSJ-32 TaxID=2841527 RepID=UPI001C0F505F|nr:diguanylate cyclase [Caproiciproducens sp. MSJ-32]MBU5454141.1 diguanylate cyclase [Caproiciproducens sp. MSJ-32]